MFTIVQPLWVRLAPTTEYMHQWRVLRLELKAGNFIGVSLFHRTFGHCSEKHPRFCLAYVVSYQCVVIVVFVFVVVCGEGG